jgi:putative salt-induced outer membrane protein
MIERTIALALLTLLPAAASAVDWQPAGELGLVASRGNSDTSTVNAKLGVKGEDDEGLYEVGVAALHGRADDELRAKRYSLAASSGHKFSAGSYLSGSIRYEDDAFAPFARQAVTAASYGHVAIAAEATSLKLELGPGFRHAERRDGTTEDAGVVRGKSDFRHRVTGSTELFNTVLVEGAGANTFAQGDLGVQVAINASVALKAGLQVRHNTEAPASLGRTDTLTTVNLVWSPKR